MPLIDSLDYWPLVTAIGIVLISATVYLYSRYKLNYWRRRGVGQLPGAHWLFGNFKDALLFRSPPGWHISSLYQQTAADAPFVGFYILHEPCLLLRDPALIKQMFLRDAEYFSDRYFAGTRQKDSLGMRNLFALRSPISEYLRSKISPTLTISKVRRMVPLMVDSAESMLGWLRARSAAGARSLDAQDLCTKYASDIIANVGFGLHTDAFNQPDTEFTRCTKDFFKSMKRFTALMSVFFLPRLVDVLGFLRPLVYFDMSFAKISFWKTIEQREETGLRRGDYVDSILALKNGKQDSRFRFDGDNLFDQAGQLFAGFESSTIAATFTLLEFGKNREAQSRAREEVRRAVAVHGWTYEALSEMDYLELCVYEGIRLYPPVTTLDRRVAREYKIPGTEVVLAPGTGVYVSTGALHRDAQHFPAPEQFRPERFSAGAGGDAFYPFGLGTRICVGAKLGLLLVKVTLALLLAEFEVLHEGGAGVLDSRSTFTVADHVTLQFTRLPDQAEDTQNVDTSPVI